MLDLFRNINNQSLQIAGPNSHSSVSRWVRLTACFKLLHDLLSSWTGVQRIGSRVIQVEIKLHRTYLPKKMYFVERSGLCDWTISRIYCRGPLNRSCGQAVLLEVWSYENLHCHCLRGVNKKCRFLGPSPD